ncbi:MAG: tyrosine-type recombinase/integrase [Xanthobacteraceae bacterium]
MTRIDFPYLMSDRDRRGIERLYVRRLGRKIRIRAKPGTEAFAGAYAEALHVLSQAHIADRPVLKGAPAGTLGWLAACYFASVEFRRLDPKSQFTRRGIIEACLREPRKPGSRDLMRDCPLSVVSPAHIKMLRDRKAATPAAANSRKYLSSMFGWAIEQGLVRFNPAREVRRVRYATAGFHSWTVDEVRQYEKRHPVGTKARLAFALLLFLGPRRGDVVTLGRQHERDGWLRFVPRKTRYKRLEATEKPILPILADIIARSPTGDLTYLVTEYGRPFTASGFGNWFRARCDEAGLPHCSAHGLRKAGATIAAENGATDRQLMALYDWTSEKQANVYTAAANRKRLAGQAAQLLARDQSANTEVSHQSVPPKKLEDRSSG